ncbi:MAG: hypothetical protein MUE67_08580 [Anaerolineales bacterium]|nr:hypothetical protein [Anaerolineales bacterium]
MNPLENILGAFQVAGTLLGSPLLRGWYNRWGASPAEAAQTLPGDELVPDLLLGYTRAITIHAPVERVWPWLAQMGQGRGGLYSYDGLENIAGCDIHSVEAILPDLQNPAMGELIRLGPKGYPCFAIATIDAPRSLVLVSANPQTEQPVLYLAQPAKGYSIATWQFVLQPIDATTTRLLVRQRLAYSPDMAWIWRLTEPIGFVMERKMLLGIRRRAERHGGLS